MSINALLDVILSSEPLFSGNEQLTINPTPVNSQTSLPQKIEMKYYEHFTIEELQKRNYKEKMRFKSFEKVHSIDEDLAPKDDEIQSQAWSQAFKSAAYYYENPTYTDRLNMMKTLDLNFDSLFQNTKNPDEVPDLRSNTHLVKWVCKKYNEYLEVKGSPNSLECNANQLLKSYGPDLKAVKRNIEGIEYFL